MIEPQAARVERVPAQRQGTTRSHPRTRWLLAGAVFVVAVMAMVGILHVPTPFADLQLYASISRSRQLYGTGVPTVTWNSPVAVDHVSFYGPIYFELCARAMRLLGVTLLSFRLVSMLGSAMILAAAALLARGLSDSRDRWLWAIALLALAPDFNASITTGAMHALAVGCDLLALAVFVRGLSRPASQSIVHGVIAGLALAAGAMTTPRSYLFIAAFFVAWLVLPLVGHPFRRTARWQGAAAAAGLCVPFLTWIVVSHGDPVRWVRYMSFIFLHEDTDVAILPTAVRALAFSWMPALTPMVALIGGLLAARGIARERRETLAESSGGAFALLTTSLTYVATAIILNYTFSNGEYFALPLFVVVVALPPRTFGLASRPLAVLVALLLVGDVGFYALRTARVAATWNASDPIPLNAFVASHVPSGSVVVGPETPYFFPVERNGSRYRTVAAASWADWARWVPIVEPESVRPAHIREAPATARFFIWPDGDDLPEHYECVRGHVVDVFVPAKNYLYLLGRLGHPTDQGYPKTVLYDLPPGCPSGYDPTVTP
jgi:hypothetical protein